MFGPTKGIRCVRIKFIVSQWPNNGEKPNRLFSVFVQKSVRFRFSEKTAVSVIFRLTAHPYTYVQMNFYAYWNENE